MPRIAAPAAGICASCFACWRSMRYAAASSMDLIGPFGKLAARKSDCPFFRRHRSTCFDRKTARTAWCGRCRICRRPLRWPSLTKRPWRFETTWGSSNPLVQSSPKTLRAKSAVRRNWITPKFFALSGTNHDSKNRRQAPARERPGAGRRVSLLIAFFTAATISLTPFPK